MHNDPGTPRRWSFYRQGLTSVSQFGASGRWTCSSAQGLPRRGKEKAIPRVTENGADDAVIYMLEYPVTPVMNGSRPTRMVL